MFSALTISADNLDVGAVAEALVYYGRTRLRVTGASLPLLVERLGYNTVIGAIELGALELSYAQVLYGVGSKKHQQLGELHNFLEISVDATADATAAGKSIQTASDQVEEHYLRHFGKSSEVINQARVLAAKVTPNTRNRDILQSAIKDAKDREFVSTAVRAFLETAVPGYSLPSKVKFEIVGVADGSSFVVLTDLNFNEINKFYHENPPVSEARILSQILAAREQLTLSAAADTDLWVSHGLSTVLEKRVTSIARRLTKAKEDINYFHKVEFEGRTFREAINTGGKTGTELLALLQDEETKKFKAWLSTQNPEAHLIKEYDRAVFSRHGWTQRLPFKASKMVAFATLGLALDAAIGTMGLATLASGALSFGADIATSASDDFIASKLLKGWKPNQFIDGPAKAFITPRQV